MTAGAYFPAEDDLPFGPPSPAERALISKPFYVGAFNAQLCRGEGPLTLEMYLSADCDLVELGPFKLDRTQLNSLYRLLRLVHALMANPKRPPPPRMALVKPRPSPREQRNAAIPAPESGRGIAGWDLSNLAKSAAEVAGCPWEGESQP